MATDNVTPDRFVRLHLAALVFAYCSSSLACGDSSYQDPKHSSTTTKDSLLQGRDKENKQKVTENTSATDTLMSKGDLSKDIIGSWQSPVHDTELGPMMFEYTFGKNGVLMCTMSNGPKELSDSVTSLSQYKVVDNQLVEVDHTRTPNRKIHINGSKLTLENEKEKMQLVKMPKTESITHFIMKAITDLKSPDGEIRWKAVQALRYAGPEARAGVPDLIATLKDDSKSVRQLALEALANIGPQEKEVVPALITVLKDKTDPTLSNIAASELGRFGSAAKDAVPTLIEKLQSDDATTCYHAIESLGNVGSAAKSALPSLRECLKKSKSKSVAEAVTKSIKMIESDVDSNNDS